MVIYLITHQSHVSALRSSFMGNQFTQEISYFISKKTNIWCS